MIQLISHGEESPINAMELAAGHLVGEAAPVHFTKVVCSGQCLADSVEIGAESVPGRKSGKRRQAMPLWRILMSLIELAVQVLLRDLDIPQSHADVFVPQQLHEGGKADSETEHFRGMRVA